MKTTHTLLRVVAAGILAAGLSAPSLAGDMGQGSPGMGMKGGMGQGAMQGMNMKGGMDMGAMGQQIHESTVDGYRLTYRVIDMKQKMEAMKGMKGMSMDMKGMDLSQMKSHHLMVFLVDPAGQPVTDGKVGYKVVGPDGAEQKAMAMGMKGGFGADVDFKAKGTYSVKMKAVAGETKLLDAFEYEVK
ncbi:MAG: hypothetical protein Kow0092_06990 [Deferrisomatales bacterium]